MFDWKTLRDLTALAMSLQQWRILLKQLSPKVLESQIHLWEGHANKATTRGIFQSAELASTTKTS